MGEPLVWTTNVLIGNEWVTVKETADEIRDRIHEAEGGDSPMDGWISLTARDSRLLRIKTRVVNGISELTPESDQ